MEAPGDKSNHDLDGGAKNVYEQLLDALSGEDVRSRLAGLSAKLAELRASNAQPRATLAHRQRPHRPGWILDAVARVLADRGEPMRSKDIHAAVEALVGETVHKGSVDNALVNHISGSVPRFVRIGRGRYVLA